MNVIKYFNPNDNNAINKNINCVSNQINTMNKRIKSGNADYFYENFNLLYENIINTLEYWVGYLQVGIPKEKNLKKNYNIFYNKLYELILLCRNFDNEEIQEFVNSSLYQGILYRYLGYNTEGECFQTPIKPECNDVWVSWSKRKNNIYFEQKLSSGPITLITCCVKKEEYGIDLKAFLANNEEEVIYPIKNIIKTEYYY